MIKSAKTFKGLKLDGTGWVQGMLQVGGFVNFEAVQCLIDTHAVNGGTICWELGVKDRDGRVIFNGDIDSTGGIVTSDGMRILLSYTSPSQCTLICEYDCNQLQIVGNIYDNHDPSLPVWNPLVKLRI